jgi:hypothetical protein
MPKLKYALAVFACFATAQACPVLAASPDVLEAYTSYANGLNAGDAKAATAPYDDNAYMVSGECMPAAPCKDPGKAKAMVEAWITYGLKLKMTEEPVVFGDMMVVKIEVTWNGIEKDMGIKRIVGYNYVEAHDGLITRKMFVPDAQDEQTKTYIKAMSGT